LGFPIEGKLATPRIFQNHVAGLHPKFELPVDEVVPGVKLIYYMQTKTRLALKEKKGATAFFLARRNDFRSVKAV